MPPLRDYIADLAAQGRFHFTLNDLKAARRLSADGARAAVHRLARQRLVASPARGFWVIVPPEYRRLGCLPAEQFVPALMEHLGLSYYAGLLSAAQFHGAAHQRPQEFQVMVTRNRRPIRCGVVRVSFVARKRLGEVPVQRFNTPRGHVLVSTPEATAIDLVGYESRAGGLDNVVTILAELSERLDSEQLVKAAKTGPLPWAQRLGYLLELCGAKAKTGLLKRYVSERAKIVTPLVPSLPDEDAYLAEGWRLLANARPEPET